MMRWTKWSVIAGPQDALVNAAGRQRSHRSNFWSIPRVTRFPSSRCPGNLQGNIERGAAWWGLLAAGRVAWVSAGTARPVPKKGELLTCPAMADSHAELTAWEYVAARDRARGTSRWSLARLHRLAFGRWLGSRMGTCRELISPAQLPVLMLEW